MKRPVADKALKTPPVIGAIDKQPRCWRCGKLLAIEVSRPWRIKCLKCHALSGSEPP